MPFVAQDTDDLGGQGIIQQTHDGFHVPFVALRDCTPLDVLPCPLPKRLNVREKGILHDESPYYFNVSPA